MIPKRAITLAEEGGWHNSIPKIIPENPNHGIPPEILEQMAVMAAAPQILMDAKFWAAIGKVKGWKLEDIYVTMESLSSPTTHLATFFSKDEMFFNAMKLMGHILSGDSESVKHFWAAIIGPEPEKPKKEVISD